MDRLTQKDEQGNWCLNGVPWGILHEGQIITRMLRERLYGALWKLMEYEDTGLTPKEMVELKDFYENPLNTAVPVLEQVEADRWIPVAERLPEIDDMVLVTVNGLYNHITFSSAIELGNLCSDGGWFIEGYPEWDDAKVIAWMPLPEPYREES